jgi:hypothetical protein
MFMDHRHSAAGYQTDKTCPECRDLRNAADRRRNHRKGYGQVLTVPTEPARAHVRDLMAQGMGQHRIAEKAGVLHGTLSRLLYWNPPLRIMKKENADRLLAVRLDTVYIDSGPSRRLICGMMAAGWPLRWISAQMGVQKLTIGPTMRRDRADQIAAVAEKAAANGPGPSDLTRAYAARHGWTVDLLWEGLDGTPGDDEDEPVDWVAVERVAAGKRPDHRLRPATRAAAIDLLIDQGLSITEIGRRLGTSGTDINRHLARRHQPQESPS